MAKKKRHWFWNLLLFLCLVLCITAFVLHYKNWTRLEADRMQLISGIYYLELPYGELNALEMVPRIPQMERINGFSVAHVEKGLFKDSINPLQKVYVYIDDLRQSKIRIQFRDSLQMYLNFKDSLETANMYQYLEEKIQAQSLE